MVDKKTTDNEDPKLGSVQAPQEGEPKGSLDTPVNDEGAADAAEAPSPAESDHQEDGNPDASKKPGEAKGRKTKEQVAAEEDPESAEETNPVAEATGRESKDPYAEGKHIANPEPNNGLGEDPEKGRAELEKQDQKEVEESVARTEQNEADQNAAQAKADKEAEEAVK